MSKEKKGIFKLIFTSYFFWGFAIILTIMDIKITQWTSLGGMYFEQYLGSMVDGMMSAFWWFFLTIGFYRLACKLFCWLKGIFKGTKVTVKKK